MLTRLGSIGIDGLDVCSNSLQFAGGTSSQCPSKIRWQAFGDVFCSQLSSVACGTKDHEVILARC